MLVREPAIAGRFYPSEANVLSQEVDGILQAMSQEKFVQTFINANQNCPKILILPHAGHQYSGLIAGIGYNLLQKHLAQIKRIVLFCPAHREYFKGVALPQTCAFATPLGTLQVDSLGVRAVQDVVIQYEKAHLLEHAIEVHLPFLQRLWAESPQFPTILPLVVGDISADYVAKILERVWGGKQTLIIISTDLSHFHPYDSARQIDENTCHKIANFSPTISHQEACGATPLNAALLIAQQKKLRIEQLAYCNSGDTPTGNTPEGRQRVVGYASFAIYENKDAENINATALNSEQGQMLTTLARQAIETAFTKKDWQLPQDPWLQNLSASFVTLIKNGQLRGCIGSLQAYRSLVQDVCMNARSASFHDPRFPALQEHELSEIKIEISILTPPQPLSFANEAHALWQLTPMQDGIIFSAYENGREYRSTFLPQVWEQLPDPTDFMARLKMKSGLNSQFWSENVRLMTYQVQKFHA